MRKYIFNGAFGQDQGKALKPRESLRMQVERLLTGQSKVAVGIKQPLHERTFIRSHFGGIPYFEQGEVWPVHEETGQPLEFVCQFVDSGIFPFPEGVQLIQFYFSFEDLHEGDVDRGWQIKTYSEVHIDKYRRVPAPMGKKITHYNPVFMIPDVSLPDYETALAVDPMIHYISKKVSRRRPYNAYNEMVRNYISDKEYGSAVGGFPNWLYHESEFDMTYFKKGYRLLAQIDTEYTAGVCWGDVGTAYLFYKPGLKNDYAFVLQKF